VAISLRPYQEDAVNAAQNAFEQGVSSGIYRIFTGGGKTIISAESIRRFANPLKGYRSLFVGGVNQGLVYQSDRELRKFLPEFDKYITVNHKSYPGFGIVMGSINHVNARIISASIQTLVDKSDSIGRGDPESHPIDKADFTVDKYGNVVKRPNSPRRFLISPRFDEILANGGPIDLWIHDEAHHAVADGSLVLIERIKQLYAAMGRKKLKIIGNTATPIRTDGRGLNTIFERVFANRTIQYAIEHGYVVPFADPIVVSAKGFTVDGDNETDNQFVTKLENWADVIVKAYLDNASDRSAIAYVGRIGDIGPITASKMLAAKFNENGIPCAHIDGEGCIDQHGNFVSNKDRGKLFQAFQEGEIKVLTNFNVLIEGIDLPRCSAILLARKVNELTFTQIIGRAIRLFPGKEDMQLIDFTGQQLVISSIGSIMGYKVDPFTKQVDVDVDLVEALNYLIQAIMQGKKDQMIEWGNLQSFIKDKTYVYNTINSLEDLAKDIPNITKLQKKIIKALYDAMTNEEDISEGDIRNLTTGFKVYGGDTIYDLGKIVNKSGNDWHIDQSLVMSMSIGQEKALVIYPPNYTVASEIDDRIAKLMETEDGAGTDTTKRLRKAAELFSQFSLWLVTKQGGSISSTIVAVNSDINALESDSLEIVQAAEEQEITKAFASKSASWKHKKEDATDKQLAYLQSLGINVSYKLSKKQAAALITHQVFATHVIQKMEGLKMSL